MGLLIQLLLAGSILGAGPGDDPPCSFLYQPAFCTDAGLRMPPEPYLPQPGDIFLATDYRKLLQFGHWLAGAKDVHRSGIVIALPGGGLALFEAGPVDRDDVVITDLISQLQCYADKEKVWIRRRAVPLTPEQSELLTDFAIRQCGKRFALWRMMSQCWPLRSRGTLRTFVIGRSNGDRCSYFCSELVVESCVAAGILDGAHTRPPATFPCDLFYAESCNPFLKLHFSPDINCGWCPPARWTDCPQASMCNLPAGR
jgi:hypothetical protein